MIQSERLDLIPLTPPILRASLAGNLREAERLLCVALPETWLDYHEVMEMRLAQIERTPGFQPWSLRAMVLRETRAVVGRIGFHTEPGPEYLDAFSPGAVELGFSVIPEFRRQGFAREAAVTLIRWAQEAHGVEHFVLSIQPKNTASQALAAGLGFVKIGAWIDAVDGEEDVLELKVAAEDWQAAIIA